MDESLLKRLLDMAVAIQQVPAPTFAEQQRADFVRDQFQAGGLAEVTVDGLGNVYGRLPGAGAKRPLVVSAHLDTVFPLDTPLDIQREDERIAGPGIGDNSLGVAGLLGLVWMLRQQGITLPGDLWLAANVGEEGLGDLRGMKAVVERFGAQALAYLVIEGMGLGHVYHRGLGVQRYRVSVHTQGGHSWVDYGRPSAVHELAKIAARLAGMTIPAQPRTTLNVGVIAGGTSVNTIASEAYFEIDLRSEEAGALLALARRVEGAVQAAHEPGSVQTKSVLIGQRPAGSIPADHPLVLAAAHCVEEQSLAPRLTIASTDASWPLSLGYPAVCLGLTVGGGAHTRQEYILTQPLHQGMAQLLGLVQAAFEI